jgi:hypothetical protein
MFGFIFAKKEKNSKEKKLLFANIVNTHVRAVIPDFVMPVMLILIIFALDVVKLIYKKKSLNIFLKTINILG